MELTQPAAPAADGMTQDQVDDVYARILAVQGKASRVLDRAARLRADMTALLGSPAAEEALA
jgi:hypothetical protein